MPLNYPSKALRTASFAILPLLAALTGACGDDAGYGDGGADDDGGPTPDAPLPYANGPDPDDEMTACDAAKPVSLFLSPDDSNSTSSPVQVRAAALDNPDDLAYVPIRTWEFLNYYSFNYSDAEPGSLAIHPEIARTDDMPAGQYVVQIGIAGESMPNADRPFMNITLVLDESGSMQGKPMDMQKAVCKAIAGSLRAGDTVSMVGWDTTNAVKLAAYTVTGPDDGQLVDACDLLAPGGGTDLNGGLVAGYELAHQQFDATRVNRVVLISDGGANAGVTDIDLIAAASGGEDGDGIYLVGVGVGRADSYNDELMDTVTDAGRGAALFIPTAEEADKMFGDRFVQTMAVAARDVRVRLDMPPGFEILTFSGEEYSTDPATIEPQHLAPNDAMVFHQTVATCAPELIDESSQFTIAVQWRDAVTFEPRSAQVSHPMSAMLASESRLLKKGAAVFAYAESLKAYKEERSSSALTPAFTALAAAEAVDANDPDLAEIRQVLQALQPY